MDDRNTKKELTSANKPWTAEEEDYLREKWGTVSIPYMAKRLGRTVNAIKVRAIRLQLGDMKKCGEYITLNQLHLAMTGTSVHGYTLKSWVKERGLPVHQKKIVNESVRIVYLDEFWEWAEKNRSFIDFSKMEPLILGEEPAWVAIQRRKDFESFALQRKDPWTPEDDSRLIMLLKQHKYGYAELSEMLNRSAGAIQRRCTDLGIKERPVKADNHSKESKWKESDYDILADGIRNGDSYMAIGRKIGKSEKAIRGKVYVVYLTENADKVRAMMGDQPWGCGAPVPTVKQAIHLPGIHIETKNQLAALCDVLTARVKQMKAEDYDYYFQRAVCMNWDELHSVCGAGCDDCDGCNEFVRIKPQYCVRCGTTFYERKENKRCAPCRSARKKSAYRKYMRLNGATR